MRSGDFQKQQLRCIISAAPTAKPLGIETVLRNEYILLLMLAFIYLVNLFLICCFTEFLLFSQHKTLFFYREERGKYTTWVRCAWLYLKKTNMKSQKVCFVRYSLDEVVPRESEQVFNYSALAMPVPCNGNWVQLRRAPTLLHSDLRTLK